jgi:hypothetical protein
MLQCWIIEKKARPAASVLRNELSTHLTNHTADYYLLLDEPYQEYNMLNAALLDESLDAGILETNSEEDSR